MRQKKSSDQKKALSKKASVNIDNQCNDKIFEEEEFEDVIGIGDYKVYYFIAYLKIYHMGGLINKNIKNLTDLAKYLYQEKKLYITIHGKYKLMKFSSILDNLHALNKDVIEELKKEQEIKDRYKSKKV